MIGTKRVFISLLGALLAVLLCTSLWAADPAATAAKGANPPLPIRMGFVWNMFSGVDRTDAKVSLRLWADIFAKEMGVRHTTETEIYDDPNEIFALLEQEKLDVGSVAPWDFLRSPSRDAFEPVLNSNVGKGLTNRRFLLVHKDSGISSLAGLKGKNLLIDNYGLSDTALRWLDTLLYKEGFPAAGSFFSKIEFFQSASKVVHPVFFGKANACVAEESALDVLKEMNPQIGHRLRIIAESPAIPGGFVVIRRTLDAERRKAFIDSALNLDSHVKGQQILTLFKIRKLVPFEPSTLDPVAKLLDDWNLGPKRRK